MNKPEIKLYGVNAALSVFARRPDAVIRAYIENRLLDTFRAQLKGLATRKRAYHLVEADELVRITESEHHEGICLLVEDEAALTPEEFVATLTPRQRCAVLALPDVGNPHNLGAIARTAAHFGIAGILIKQPQRLKSGAALRVAAGGFESVRIIEASDWEHTLEVFARAEFKLIATSSHAKLDLYAAPLHSRCIFALGSEGDGLADGWLEVADQVVNIPGSGNVESLNVSVAAGVLMAEYYRRFK